MFKPTVGEVAFIGLLLQGYFYGLYTGIFLMYLRYQTSNKNTRKTQNIIFYFMCALYIFSLAVFVCNIASFKYQFSPNKPMNSMVLLRIIGYIQSASFGCCDAIAQFILIYRCWIVWGCNIRVVAVPSILTFAFLITWLSSNGSVYISSDLPALPRWGYLTNLTSLALSLTVNALVTGLIVFRISKMFSEIKNTSDGQILLDATGGSKVRRTILVLIESGMALFAIQLARLVVSIGVAFDGFIITSSIHEMLNGITPTIILVRTSMGLSFHDEKSTEEDAAGESLHFAPNHPDSVPDTESTLTTTVCMNTRDDGGIQPDNDIEIVER